MQSSPLSLASTWDLVASHYVREVAPIFEYFAEQALELARVTPGMRVVDVAAGPGTLSFLAAERGLDVDALDLSPQMIDALHARAQQTQLSAGGGAGRIVARLGDGMALPYPDRLYDAGFSMFGLMFFPDRAAGFRELARVLKPGARAVVASWVPMVQNPPVWAAVEALTQLTSPELPTDVPPPPLPLGSPEQCVAEMAAADFTDVTVHELTASSQFASTAEMIASYGRTSAPFALNKQRLGKAWPDIEAEIVRRVEKRIGSGPQTVGLPAYLTVGVRG